MMSPLISALYLLSREERRKVYQSQAVSVLAGVLETLSIATMALLFGVVSGSENSNQVLDIVMSVLGISCASCEVQLLTVSALGLLSCSTVMLVYTNWLMAKLSYQFGAGLSVRVFKRLINRGYEFFLRNGSSELINIVQIEVTRVSDNYFYPAMLLSSKIIGGLVISAGLFFVDPWLFLGVVSFCVLIYVFIFLALRKRLQKYSKVVSIASDSKLRLLTDVFDTIETVKLSKCEGYFSSSFQSHCYLHAMAVTKSTVFSVVPRYFVEFLLLSFLLISILFYGSTSSNFSGSMTLIAMYGISGIKLLPTVQHAYSAFSQMQANSQSLKLVQDVMSEQNHRDVSSYGRSPKAALQDDSYDVNSIYVNAVSYRYPNATKYALSGVTLKIASRTSVGFVGLSGSGKSTFMLVLLGLLEPTEGKIIFGGRDDNVKNLYSRLSGNVGYVPQAVNLISGSIRENVCFGLDIGQINEERLHECLKRSHLDKFINALPDGLDTKLGAGGIRLSGGQRQRIGIARALYVKPRFLLFDEATSALDSVTESIVSKAVRELSEETTTILITHRIETVRHCDVIHVLDKGVLVASGTYDDLIQKSEKFRNLAEFKVV